MVAALENVETLDSGRTKLLVWKNTLLLGFGWLLHFMGLFPIITVQSSLNSSEGLGTVSLSVQTAFSIFTCMFLSTGVIHKLGTKWTITIGSVMNAFYIAANFYPTWATLVPTASLAGIGGSLMWTAHTTYLSKLTKFYADKTGADVNAVTVRFFGVFFALFYSSSIFGNVASSLILGLGSSMDSNRTFAYDTQQICGAAYCNEDLGTSFKPGSVSAFGNVTNNRTSASFNRVPDKVRVYVLCGFCLTAVGLSTVLLGVFLDKLQRFGISEKSAEDKSTWSFLVATFLNLKNPKQLLLLPLTFYNGMDNYFLNTDFTKAFITCPLGMQYIGVITACSGAFSLASSFLGGWFNSRNTRWVPFVVAAFSHIIPAVVMLYWIPSENNTTVQYVLSSAWGIGSGVWSAQMGAYYGVVFADNLEPAISNLVLWNSLALTLLYGLSHVLCIFIKIYFVLGILVVGMIGFAVVELEFLVQDYRTRKSNAIKTVSLASITKHPDGE